MKITLFYENKNNPTTLDVPDEEFDVMVETDYRQRLAVAADKSAVVKRTVQEILDEEINKPTFNNQQTETRRHVSLSSSDFDPQGNFVVGAEDVQIDLFGKDFSEFHHAIEKLRPQQKNLIRDIFWEEMRQVDIAKRDGVDKAAIAGRLKRTIERLKKFLLNQKNFSQKNH